MEGFVLVGRAYASRGQWREVLDVLARAEEAYVAASAEGSGEAGERQAGDGSPAARQPPAELYEVAARTLARAGMWEEAASVVRRLEVRVHRYSVLFGRCFNFCECGSVVDDSCEAVGRLSLSDGGVALSEALPTRAPRSWAYSRLCCCGLVPT